MSAIGTIAEEEYQRGYRAGLEAAAKVAESHITGKSDKQQYDMACLYVAGCIRALLEKQP